MGRVSAKCWMWRYGNLMPKADHHRDTARRSRNQTWIAAKLWQAQPPHPPVGTFSPAEKRGREGLSRVRKRFLFSRGDRRFGRNLSGARRNYQLVVQSSVSVSSVLLTSDFCA